ncbi:MAG: hypothetical protein HOJ94_16515, partial [Alphaproteobacteria bacterium]|nr:hypothetical protein [Alphaproteobacteria bacterium]
MTRIFISALCFSMASVLAAGPAFAHASEQSFVLLLPTDIYIRFGVAAVALTILVLAFLPAARTTGLFAGKTILRFRQSGFETVTSLASLTFLFVLVMF